MAALAAATRRGCPPLRTKKAFGTASSLRKPPKSLFFFLVCRQLSVGAARCAGVAGRFFSRWLFAGEALLQKADGVGKGLVVDCRFVNDVLQIKGSE